MAGGFFGFLVFFCPLSEGETVFHSEGHGGPLKEDIMAGDQSGDQRVWVWKHRRVVWVGSEEAYEAFLQLASPDLLRFDIPLSEVERAREDRRWEGRPWLRCKKDECWWPHHDFRKSQEHLMDPAWEVIYCLEGALDIDLSQIENGEDLVVGTDPLDGVFAEVHFASYDEDVDSEWREFRYRQLRRNSGRVYRQ